MSCGHLIYYDKFSYFLSSLVDGALMAFTSAFVSSPNELQGHCFMVRCPKRVQ